MPCMSPAYTVRPSRITVMRSHTAYSSSRRCETKITETPLAFRPRITPNSVSTSRSFKLLVGSSMMTSRALIDTARASATIC